MERRADVGLRTGHASGYPRENLPTPPTDRLQIDLKNKLTSYLEFVILLIYGLRSLSMEL